MTTGMTICKLYRELNNSGGFHAFCLSPAFSANTGQYTAALEWLQNFDSRLMSKQQRADNAFDSLESVSPWYMDQFVISSTYGIWLVSVLSIQV